MLSSQSRTDVKNQASVPSAFDGTSPLRRQAEKTQAVQKKAPRRPDSGLSVSKRGL